MENEKTETSSEISVNSLLKGVFGHVYKGNDNYDKPKTEYLEKLVAMDREELFEETKNKIWLSAYAANNSKSDYHWQCTACYEVAKKFEDLYDLAHKSVSKQ